MLKLAARNLFRQAVRTLMTLMVISFGVVGLILSGGFVEDIFVQLREATIHSRLGHIQIYDQGYYEYGRRDPYAHMIEEPEALARQLRQWPAVDEVMQRVNFFGLVNNGRTDLPILGEGIQPDREAELGSFFFIVEGRQLTNEDEFGVLLGEGVAAALSVDPGDFVNVLLNTPDGALNSLEFEVVGVFRTFSKEFDDRAIRIPLASAQTLLDTERAHALVLALHASEVTDDVTGWLRDQLGPAGFEVYTWLQLDDFYPKTVELYKGQFGFFQLIILLIVLLSVLSSISMTMNERRGEFGTLRALGLRSRDLYRAILVESALLGLLGAMSGVVLGIVLALAISAVGIPMPPPPNASAGYTAYIRIVPAVVAWSFAIGFIAALLSAALAARKPTREPIVDALRRNV